MTIARLASAMMLSVFVLVSGAAQESQAPESPQARQPQPEPPPEQDEPRTLEEIFIPSEEIAADEEVTFPVDI